MLLFSAIKANSINLGDKLKTRVVSLGVKGIAYSVLDQAFCLSGQVNA